MPIETWRIQLKTTIFSQVRSQKLPFNSTGHSDSLIGLHMIWHTMPFPVHDIVHACSRELNTWANCNPIPSNAVTPTNLQPNWGMADISGAAQTFQFKHPKLEICNSDPLQLSNYLSRLKPTAIIYLAIFWWGTAHSNPLNKFHIQSNCQKVPKFTSTCQIHSIPKMYKKHKIKYIISSHTTTNKTQIQYKIFWNERWLEEV
jgi:hypothetical protein